MTQNDSKMFKAIQNKMRNIIHHKSHEKSDKYHKFLLMSEQQQEQQTRSIDLRFSLSKKQEVPMRIEKADTKFYSTR